MKTVMLKFVVLGLFTMPLVAWAGGKSGFYLGGGIGQSRMKVDTTNVSGDEFKFDGNDTGYKIIAGYNFGLIPLLDLGVEGSYVDFGKISNSTLLGTANTKTTGFDGFGVAALTFGPLGVFGKVGVIRWNTDVTLLGATASESGSDGAYGVGVRFQLKAISLRAEYEVFDVSKLKDLSMASVSVLYTF